MSGQTSSFNAAGLAHKPKQQRMRSSLPRIVDNVRPVMARWRRVTQDHLSKLPKELDVAQLEEYGVGGYHSAKVSRPIESIDLEPELELHIARETRRLTEERDEWLAARRKALNDERCRHLLTTILDEWECSEAVIEKAVDDAIENGTLLLESNKLVDFGSEVAAKAGEDDFSSGLLIPAVFDTHSDAWRKVTSTRTKALALSSFKPHSNVFVTEQPAEPLHTELHDSTELAAGPHHSTMPPPVSAARHKGAHKALSRRVSKRDGLPRS